MRVAFYGNNLNAGFTFVRGLRRLGVDAELFYIPSGYSQDEPHWWSTDADTGHWVHVLTDFDRAVEEPLASVGGSARLISRAPVRRLYDALRTFDVVVVTEHGPALLSEFDAAPKVFVSFGSDLQVTPFLVTTHCRPAIADIMRRHWRLVRSGQRSLRQFYRDLRSYVDGMGGIYYRLQIRQRRGIRQCALVVCAPYQRALARRIGVPARRITHLPLLPMDAAQLAEADEAQVAELESRYATFDLVVLHPTRQFYRRENGDRFLKDNDKLIRAYARFVRTTRHAVRLLLVAKGRDEQHARHLVRDLELEPFVEWLPELPNHQLRAFYRLPNVVVCDQFNPALASLGNIGREASFFGRPLVTAFGADNEVTYPGDPPPHVFAAETDGEVFAALERLSALSTGERNALGVAATAWFNRHFDSARAIPRYLDALRAVHARRQA
jgi:glycosyltransferase involved in cell wall biosynthesis